MYKYKRLLAVLSMIIAISFVLTACSYKSIDDDDEDSTKSKEKNTMTSEVDSTEEATSHADGFGSSKNCKEHTWVDATCKAPKTCSKCGKTDGKKGDHNYIQSIEKAATCLKSGTKKFICEYCDDYYTEEYSLEKYDSTSIYEMYEKSVGEVITYDKDGNSLALGTCFVYSSDGVVITNYHVIDGAYSAEVTIGTKTYDVKQVLAYDVTIDIAVLRVNGKNLRKANICTETHKAGAKVYALGSSQGLTLTFSQGMITHSNREIEGVVYTQHDASISSGNSGGPLINEYGEVIGINTWTLLESQNLNFAINVSELENLDYSNPMTLEQVYNKELTAFDELCMYTLTNGECLEDGDYWVDLYAYSTSEHEHGVAMYYSVSYDEMVFVYYIDEGVNWFSFAVDADLSGEYFWDYIDDEYQMYGKLDAAAYTEGDMLSYIETDAPDDLIDELQDLTRSMMGALIETLDVKLEDIGISLSDLGFTV